MIRPILLAIGVVFALTTNSAAQDDIANVPSKDLRAGEVAEQRYFLIGPAATGVVPIQGYGLILVLPGGDGGPDFLPFVKRIYKNALPPGYLVAQLVPPKWEANQQVVWPTEKPRIAAAKFTTEAFADAVIDDVSKKHKLNPARVMTLAWSSGGPAAYAIALNNPKVRGSFVAMSVFKPDELPALEQAKSHAFFIYHSPVDRVCPMRMAENAAKQLSAVGAKTKLTTYDGGHGWQGNVFGDIRAGVAWLEGSVSKP